MFVEDKKQVDLKRNAENRSYFSIIATNLNLH